MSNNVPQRPEDAAKYFSEIREGNYFAHTIREMERKIYSMTGAKRVPFHITIKVCDATNGGSAVVFYHSGCTIFLPESCSDIDNKDIRLILAHELGHISYNINALGVITGRTSPSKEEEVYAWEFAHCLTKIRSEGFKKGIGKDHIFSDEDLGKLLIRNVKKQRLDIYDDIKMFLGGRKR